MMNHRPLFVALAALAAQALLAQPQLDWAAHVGGNAFAGATAVTTDPSGNTITVGYFQNGTIDFDPGPGTLELTPENARDIFVQKLDADGGLVWAFRIGGEGSDESYAVTTDAQGNIYLSGTFDVEIDIDPGPGSVLLEVPSGNDLDAFLVKYDPDGVPLGSWLFSGNNLERIFGIAVDGQGNIHLSGRFESDMDLDPGPGTMVLNSQGSGDAFAAKLDASGTLLWGRSMGGAQLDAGYELALGPNGEVAVCGFFQSLSMDADPGPGEALLTSTNTNADAFVWWLTANGEHLHSVAFGTTGTDRAYGIGMDDLGNTYVTGEVDDVTTLAPGISFGAGSGTRHFYVAGFDAMQEPMWGMGSVGTGTSRGYSLTVTDQGHVAACGEYAGELTVDAEGTFTLPAEGGTEAWVMVLNASGDLLYPGACTGLGDVVASTVAAAPGGGLRVAGSFEGTVDLDPDTTVVLNASAADATELYTLAWDLAGIPTTVASPSESSGDVQVFPRPAHEVVHIARARAGMGRAVLMDARGAVVRTISLRDLREQLSVHDLPAGTYLLCVEEALGSHRTKVLVVH